MADFSFFKSSRNSAASTIRANQMAEALGGKVNPKDGYDSDICIYVKMTPPENFPERSYYDLNDHWPFVEWVINHPKIKIITMSKSGYDYVSEMTNRKDVKLIPQHHCNHLNEKRTRKEVTTAGLIGGMRACELNHGDLAYELNKIGMYFVECIHPASREAVVDFYKKIDIQVVFRPKRSRDELAGRMSTSLKLANAGSFGIPTVTYPEDSFVYEFGGCFLSAMSPEELVHGVKKLRDNPEIYFELSSRSEYVASGYHINRIVELYRQQL